MLEHRDVDVSKTLAYGVAGAVFSYLVVATAAPILLAKRPPQLDDYTIEGPEDGLVLGTAAFLGGVGGALAHLAIG